MHHQSLLFTFAALWFGLRAFPSVLSLPYLLHVSSGAVILLRKRGVSLLYHEDVRHGKCVYAQFEMRCFGAADMSLAFFWLSVELEARLLDAVVDITWMSLVGR